jgi:hypothetical protein
MKLNEIISRNVEKALKILKKKHAIDSFIANLRVFVFGLLFFCAVVDVTEYQKVTILKYRIEKFPRHVVIETFFAEQCNGMLRFYIRHRYTLPRPNAIPVKIEFKSLI